MLIVLPDYAEIQAASKHRTSVGRSSAENFLNEGGSSISNSFSDSLDQVFSRSSESLGMVAHFDEDDGGALHLPLSPKASSAKGMCPLAERILRGSARRGIDDTFSTKGFDRIDRRLIGRLPGV